MQSDHQDRRDSCFSLVSDRLLIVLMVLGLYGILMQRYPIIYGGDPVARLVNSARILIGHQLPLLQALIHQTMRWFYGPKSIFLLMSFISAASCAGLYSLAREITNDRRAAWLAAILYATHPFIIYYSRVPYQEPLLMAGTAWGFYYLFRPASRTSQLLSSLFFGVACFSRYEGWIAAFAAALFKIRENIRQEDKMRFLSVARSLLLFGWAPALWIFWNRDVSPAGTYVLDLELHLSKFYRSYFVAKSALWWTESAVVLMAVIGFACSWLDVRLRKEGRFNTLLGCVILFLAALVFSGHGIEPDATRIVTEREAFVPISILILYAGLGGSWLIGEFQEGVVRGWVRIGVPLFAVLVAGGYSLNKGFKHVATANADPDLKTDYQVAEFLAGKQAGGLVLAAPLPPGPMMSYLHSVEKWSGMEGKEKAKQLLSSAETTPLDYQRVLMYSWMGKDKVISGDQLQGLGRSGIERYLAERRIDYLIVFKDFTPAAEHERILMSCFVERLPPELVIHNGAKIAMIYPIHPRDAERKGQG